MRVGALLLVCGSLIGLSSAQIKACYAWDGSSSGNFPCDPEADVRLPNRSPDLLL